MTGLAAAALAGLLGAGCSLAYDWDECGVDADCDPFETAGQDLVCKATKCVSASGQTGKLPRVAYLYVGPVGDYGWTKTHDEGRLALEAAFPGIDTTFSPSVAPADAPAAIDQFIADGYDLVIGTSHDFLSQIQSAAANNTSTKFLLTAGFVTSPNLGSYMGRMDQPKWLAGRLAAKMSKTKRLGYVSSIVIPETISHINAFTLGARSVDPDVVVMATFIGAWFAPDEEAAAANLLIDDGVDVITNGTDTPATIEAAEKRKTADDRQVLSIGYDNPTTCELFGPKGCIASAYYNWGPMIVRLVTQIRDGTWDPRAIVWDRMTGDSESSPVYLTSPSPTLVPSNVRVDVEGYISKFASGELDVFAGDINDNQGGTRTGLDDEDVLRMCWFVDGVVEPAANPPFAPKAVGAGCIGDP
ncbi:MAG: BMP family ABC transporter substrate-binding protein [Myxococcota bacterium]